jgi:hypothetical protein
MSLVQRIHLFEKKAASIMMIKKNIFYSEVSIRFCTIMTCHYLNCFCFTDNLKSIDLLKDISLEVELNSGKKIDISQFRRQFQSIYIFAITELFKDKKLYNS